MAKGEKQDVFVLLLRRLLFQGIQGMCQVLAGHSPHSLATMHRHWLPILFLLGLFQQTLLIRVLEEGWRRWG
jgi:hypothetical protein